MIIVSTPHERICFMGKFGVDAENKQNDYVPIGGTI